MKKEWIMKVLCRVVMGFVLLSTFLLREASADYQSEINTATLRHTAKPSLKVGKTEPVTQQAASLREIITPTLKLTGKRIFNIPKSKQTTPMMAQGHPEGIGAHMTSDVYVEPQKVMTSDHKGLSKKVTTGPAAGKQKSGGLTMGSEHGVFVKQD